MKRLIWIGLAAAATLVAQPGPGFGRGPGRGPGGPMGPGGPEMRNPVTGAPFSGTETVTSTQTLANGSTITHTSTTTFYRDSSGRIRTETTRPARPGSNEGPQTIVTISDPVAGVIHNLDTANKVSRDMTVRRPNANGQARPARTPQQGAGQDRAFRGGQNNDPHVVHETLMGQTIGGVYASGARSTRTIPAGAQGNSQDLQMVHETWTSTDLKIPVLVKESDPIHGTTTRQMSNITRAEPDPSLFQVPAGYTTQAGGPGRGPGGPGGRRGPGGPGGQIR